MALTTIITKQSKRLFHKTLKLTLPHLLHSKPKNTPSSLLLRKDEFRQVFHYFDTDGNGKLSSDELQAYFESVGESMSSDEARRAIMEFDKDGDEVLVFGEFVELMERGDHEEGDEDLRRAFEMFEVEKGCGCITPKGLQQVLKRLGDAKSREECKAMIRAFDLDGNGVLDFNEFNKMMTRVA
ncbi:Calcium-binding protein [Actinidia chinensis var. chinensis]|uniref:Calcium-binding protein n=1 Tax=Actinidia chinensis var. chinensis TaxID=1590841 RepID=A0A2R6RN03_ACTCC|nr:Calcium-binding protein [Actinidia chinensis var. chinensis]